MYEDQASRWGTKELIAESLGTRLDVRTVSLAYFAAIQDVEGPSYDSRVATKGDLPFQSEQRHSQHHTTARVAGEVTAEEGTVLFETVELSNNQKPTPHLAMKADLYHHFCGVKV